MMAACMAACLVPAAFAQSASAQTGDCLPQAEDAWIRLTPAGMPMHAGFVRIRNTCPQAVAIVSASSPAYADVQLHRTEVVDGVSRMRHLPELVVSAQGSAELRPGGMHLMLMRPERALQPGQTVPVQFTTRDGHTVTVEFNVRAAAARR